MPKYTIVVESTQRMPVIIEADNVDEASLEAVNQAERNVGFTGGEQVISVNAVAIFNGDIQQEFEDRGIEVDDLDSFAEADLSLKDREIYRNYISWFEI